MRTQQTRRFQTAHGAAVLLSALLLSACGNRPETAREVGSAQPAAALTPIVQDEVAFEAMRARDAGITAGVDARLEQDGRLNAQAIDIDTSKGRVVLRGLAPDRASRERATVLAKQVDGVRSVENLLHVRDEEPPPAIETQRG